MIYVITHGVGESNNNHHQQQTTLSLTHTHRHTHTLTATIATATTAAVKVKIMRRGEERRGGGWEVTTQKPTHLTQGQYVLSQSPGSIYIVRRTGRGKEGQEGGGEDEG